MFRDCVLNYGKDMHVFTINFIWPWMDYYSMIIRTISHIIAGYFIDSDPTELVDLWITGRLVPRFMLWIWFHARYDP